MKSSRKNVGRAVSPAAGQTGRPAPVKLLYAFAILALAGICARADLPRWFQDIRAAQRFEGVFTTTVKMPDGPVTVRRTPAETRASLTQLIAASPNEAELYALRARAAEEQLDAAAAESDWIQQAKLAADPGAGELALADFYHRRLRASDEAHALEAAAETPNPGREKFLPVTEQRAWRTIERLKALVEAQALPAADGEATYRLWIKRYAQRRTVYQGFFSYLLDKNRLAEADALIGDYRKTFPGDAVFPTSARASLARSRGSADQALAIYDQAFQPLWPPELVKDYFALLTETHSLRTYLGRARAAAAANPVDLDPAARIFYYYQQQGNLPEAKRALVEFRQRKDARQSAWSAKELWTMGRLMEAVNDSDEAARDYHALYALAGATPADQERALAAMTQLLFSVPEQPIRFGAGDLSLYKDIATMDPHPGFLNGILSLLLNSAMPEYKYSDEDQKSVAYFHRARAAELVTLFDAKFPKSNRRPALKAKLVEAYATYGDNDGVIRAGKQFLAAFPKSRLRTEVALRMADAYARKQDAASEFATYDALLKELAERAGGVPLGENATVDEAEAAPAESAEGEETAEGQTQPPPRFEQATQVGETPQTARSADYAKVLDRYLSRLVSLHRQLDALSLLKRELDRNPNDPGLYARLAAFIEANKLEAGIEQVYRRAIQQFSSIAWYDRLARWYVRHRRTDSLEQLSKQVVDMFSGSEIESYLRNARTSEFTSSVYLSVNLYAHERFPHDLVFVHNLLAAYSRPGMEMSPEYESLLRNYWFYEDGLRREYFMRLSALGRLSGDVDALQVTDPAAMAATNPAAVRFVGEAQAWWTHFEAAAPALEAVAARFPGDAGMVSRAASLDRSLAAFDPSYTQRAAAFEDKLCQFDLRDRKALTDLGEIYADREEYAKALPYWERIARIEPGKPDGSLEAATIFWDYYQFDDALRLIEEARKQAANPLLYAYEAGAIYESKGETDRGIAEYMKVAGLGGQARERLIVLAKRPAHRAPIDRLTSEAVAGPNPDAPALALRIAVLEGQGRNAEVGPLLADLASRTTSLDLLAAIRSDATSRGFEAAVERTEQREVAITADPVDRMRAQMALMRYYESKKDTPAAERAVEELYRANPAILGVVRATVDFYWRNKMPAKAVDTLAAAAGVANASLKNSFTLEAAGKAAESGDFTRARQFAGALLDQDPLKAEYVAAMATVFERSGDDAGLRAFYEGKIEALRTAQFTSAERAARIAELRRSLIPVLTRQKDYAGGMDQYIEVLRAFPEDDALVREAALYGAAHNGRERLRAYFVKASADSPRDFRWPMVLARIETFFEDLPAAITAYSRSIAIRPDRVDLRIARVSLEERLMRFDDALAGYVKLYDLSYHDPQWMQKEGEVYARRGQRKEAVAALRKGFIEGRPERPQDFFEVARILDSWNLDADARPFAERGVKLAGAYLFTENAPGAAVYARVMLRLRAYDAAFDALGAFDLGAGVVASDYTPEEKSAFEAVLEKRKAALGQAKLLPLAMGAGLTRLEAKWRFELMMANPGESSQQHLSRLIELQRLRMRYDELGVQLEAYSQAVPANFARESLLEQAAEAYRASGNVGAEMRALALCRESPGMSGEALRRYFELLAVHAPERLVEEAAREDLAANVAVASGNVKLALDAVRSRGGSLPRVWTRAYTGLTGLYYADTAPEVGSAFAEAIGDAAIGARLGHPVDRDERLAGGVWFYYGTAYGEYVALAKTGDPEDYLPGLVEGTPARADAYATLADLYRDNHDAARALADYAHVLELHADRGDVYDKMALIRWEEGKRDQAIADWKSAFAAFRRMEDNRLPETFWTDLPAALEHIGSRKLLGQVRAEADSALRLYIRRNGYYRVEPLMEGAMAAAAGTADGVAWIIDLSRAAPDPLGVLSAALDSKLFDDAQRETLYQRILDDTAAKAAQPGPEHESAVQTAGGWRLRWIGYLLDGKQTARAQAAIDALPKDQPGLAPLQIRAAAQAGRLPALIDSWKRNPEETPAPDTLRESAAALKQAGDAADARRLLELVYTRAIDGHDFTAANFLGLAEVRIDQGNLPAALALLRRMTLSADEPFQDLAPAADLLISTGHKAEAREFLEARVKAAPWDSESRVKLGDASVARQPEAPYRTRLEAAELAPGSGFGSGELDLLAGGASPPAASVEKPYFYFARLKAAEAATKAQDRVPLLLGAIAIDPSPAKPRLLLLRAALESGDPQIAQSAAEPLVGNFRYTLRRTEAVNDADLAGETQGFLSDLSGAPERASVSRLLAQTATQLDELNQAILLYRISLDIEPSSEASAALAQVRAVAERRAQNARRRPAIGKDLEQERLVEPRLAEGGLPK